jgi:hypothetical protein
MKLNNTGAYKRRTLSLPIGRKPISKARLHKRAPSDIPGHELRRLVAAMVD